MFDFIICVILTLSDSENSVCNESVFLWPGLIVCKMMGTIFCSLTCTVDKNSESRRSTGCRIQFPNIPLNLNQIKHMLSRLPLSV